MRKYKNVFFFDVIDDDVDDDHTSYVSKKKLTYRKNIKFLVKATTTTTILFVKMKERKNR